MSTPAELAARLRRMALFGSQKTLYYGAADHLGRIEGLEAQVARLTIERDRLIEGWPGRPSSLIMPLGTGLDSNLWYANEPGAIGYPTKAAAVRAKAGLEPEEGTT